MYKLIASDMDETFLSENHKPVPENITIIRKLRDRGIEFVPSSGRPYWSIIESLSEIEDELKGTYVSSLNGGCIHRIGEAEPIVIHTMDLDLIKELYNLGIELGVGIHVYGVNGEIWAKNVPDYEKKWFSCFPQFIIVEDDTPDFLDGKNIAKILFAKEDVAWLNSMAKTMQEKYPNLTITISSNRFLEMNPKGISKASALKEIAYMLGVDMQHTMAVGDSPNDNEMLRASHTGIAVANAHPDTKAVADIVLESSNNDGVFPEIYERFFF